MKVNTWSPKELHSWTMNIKSGRDSLVAGFLGAAASIIGKVRNDTATNVGVRLQWAQQISLAPDSPFVQLSYDSCSLFRFAFCVEVNFTSEIFTGALPSLVFTILVVLGNTSSRVMYDGVFQYSYGLLSAASSWKKWVRERDSHQLVVELVVFRTSWLRGTWRDNRHLLDHR